MAKGSNEGRPAKPKKTAERAAHRKVTRENGGIPAEEVASRKIVPTPEVPPPVRTPLTAESTSEIPAPTTEKPFDASAYAKSVGEVYANLESRIKESGLNPNRLGIWGKAVEARESVDALAKMLEAEQDPAKRARFENRIRLFGEDLIGGINGKIGDAILLSEKRRGKGKSAEPRTQKTKPQTARPVAEAVSTQDVDVNLEATSAIPVGVDITELVRREKEKAHEEVKGIAAANAATAKLPSADPDAPTVKMSVPVHIPVTEFSPAAELEGESPREIEERIEAMKEAPKAEIPPEDDTLLNLFKARKEPPMSAVFRTIRGRPENAATEARTSMYKPGPDRDRVPRVAGTPRLWREKLKDVVKGFFDISDGGGSTPSETHAEESRGTVKNAVEWWKSSEEGLIRRSRELDAAAEKIGWTEDKFRKFGEWYNRRDWKTKLAVGASLGVGAAVTAGVSMPIAFACMSGIAAQRAAGLATMYLKFEKDSQDEKWGKEKAMLKAGVYTALMSVAIKEAIEYASETEVAHTMQAKIEGWLGGILGHHAHTPEVVPPSGPAESGIKIMHPGYETRGFAHHGTTEPIAPDRHVPTAAPDFKAPAVPDIRSPGGIRSFEAAQEAASAPAPSIEMPTVGAKTGHGYEWMMKRMWEQLQSQHLDASKFDADSDIHKLLTADATTIDKVVHQIAADAKHGFFNADGTSIRVDPTAHMTVVDGQLHVADAMHPDIVHAAPDMHTTPVYHPGVPAAPSAAIVSPPEIVPGPDWTVAQDLAEQSRDIAPAAAVAAVAAIAVPKSSMIPLHSDEHPLVWHQLGATVSPSESHIYADTSAKKLFVFGGSSEEKKRIITEYLTKHRDKIIYAADSSGAHRIPWFRDLNGELTQGPPVRTEGILGLFSPLMKPPGPDELGKIIV